MARLGRTIEKKATEATVRHSVGGLASDAQRRPLRSASLFSLGGVVGVAAGWVAGRKAA